MNDTGGSPNRKMIVVSGSVVGVDLERSLELDGGAIQVSPSPVDDTQIVVRHMVVPEAPDGFA